MALMDTMVGVLANQATYYLVSGEAPKRMGNAHASVVPYQTFHPKTLDLALAIAGEKIWRKFCLAIGCPELADDPRYTSTLERSRNRDSLLPTLQQVFLTRTYEEWEKILLANDIPVGAINNIAQVIEHPQVKARNTFVELDHPTSGKVRVVGSPVRLSKTPAKISTPAPTHGQHTREVLREVLGLSADEISALDAQGVLGK